MGYLTEFELALVIVAVPVLFVGIVNFIWMISLNHLND